MRSPEKTAEKISPPMMIVTIVLTLFMSAGSPVSAAPNCDRDNDGFFSGKGKGCSDSPYPLDPDDSNYCVVPDGYEPPDPDLCIDGGGGGDSDAPDPYNLARASFDDFPNVNYPVRRGISSDGQAWCNVPRPDGPSPVRYDYWAWQEALLGGGQSIHDQAPNAECVMFDNRSDVSGGGRWFLITTAGPDPVSEPVRWLVFDFSNSPTGDGCPNLDGDKKPSGEQDLGPIYWNADKTEWLYLNPLDDDPCVDHLTVRLPADRILKSNATEQKLEISIRYQPLDSIYWPPWGGVQYLEPVYLRDPDPITDIYSRDPFQGRDCKIMSTRPSAPRLDPIENKVVYPPHNRMTAELYMWDSPSSGELVGTYNMPFEVCVIRTSD